MKTNNNINTTPTTNQPFVLEPLVYQPTEGLKPGKFIDLHWDNTPKKNDAPRRDLVLVVELEEKDALDQPVQVAQAFNLLPGGRGLSSFKGQMQSFLTQPLTPLQLAKLDPDIVVGKPVIVSYKKNHLGHVVFDKYLPVKPTQPAAA